MTDAVPKAAAAAVRVAAPSLHEPALVAAGRQAKPLACRTEARICAAAGLRETARHAVARLRQWAAANA